MLKFIFGHSSQSGASIASALVAVGVVAITFAGYTASKMNTAKSKRQMESRLDYKQMESTFRSTLSKELSYFSFGDMKCEDVGHQTVLGGLPEFMQTGNSLLRAGLTFSTAVAADFDYVDAAGAENMRGRSIHQQLIGACQGSSIVGRQTRDGSGDPIIYDEKSLFMCIKIVSPETLVSWATVEYQFLDHVTGERLTCPEFVAKRSDDAQKPRLGGRLKYQLQWVDLAGKVAQTHKGTMRSTNDHSEAAEASKFLDCSVDWTSTSTYITHYEPIAGTGYYCSGKTDLVFHPSAKNFNFTLKAFEGVDDNHASVKLGTTEIFACSAAESFGLTQHRHDVNIDLSALLNAGERRLSTRIYNTKTDRCAIGFTIFGTYQAKQCDPLTLDRNVCRSAFDPSCY